MESTGVFTCTLLWLAASSAIVRAQDNLPPTFRSPLAVFTPNEEQPAGTVIGIVVADDADRDPIRYYIGPGTINANYFDVNETTGEVSLERELDREALAPSNEPLLLYIRATDDVDHDTPDPQQEIRIFLRDINDNAPQFVNLPRTVTFREDTNEGTTILNVQVTDRDTGANAQLQYRIESIDGAQCTVNCMFSIRQSSGVVELEQSLDYETARQHTVSIIVQDRGNPPNMVEEDLTVAVRDVNDRNPNFLQNDYFAEVHENLTSGDRVAQVRAIDQDFGVNDAVIYDIISGNLEINGVDSFTINNETGVIYVNTPTLDRETYQQYMLTIRASEVNDPTKTDTTRVHITILDINDHSPVFTQRAYFVNVSESQALESVLVTVTAMDRDFGINADFQFQLVNLIDPSLRLPFRIDHNELSGEGRIVLIDELDYEEQTLYLFNVVATEIVDSSPQSGSTLVSVTVINENDNAPVFVNQSYTVAIPENAPAGIFVVMVRATDDDVGIFGEVEYSFEDTVVDFNISAANGRVVTTRALDYEAQSQYVLSVRASDLHPTLSREDTVQLAVNLENLNDNPPRFVDNGVDVQSLVVMAPEEVAPPLIVYTFDVLDLDGNLNEFNFEIVDGNLLGHFEIEGAQLRTTVPLNYDLRTSGTRSYTLTVSVNDTEHVDYVEVTVLVLDMNDNDPEFSNETYSFFVQENEPEGFVVGEVFAEDIDSGTYGEVLYSISGPGSENFEINATSGVISTLSRLDRELRPDPFNLVVMATDQDESVGNRNQVSVSLTIYVFDENDNSPEFVESTYIFQVEENTDFIEFQVGATDIDLGSNSAVTYSIVDGNVKQTFSIDGLSGVITRNSAVYLDRERVRMYTLNVSATDGGAPPNAASVEVIINILDVNDVIPTFTQTEYNATIREDVSPNAIVTDELFAFDNDANEFGQVTYSITSVTAPMDSRLTGSFVIVPNTGVVRTTGTFDREVFPGPYTIMVLGRDGGFPVSNNGTATLLVYIEDANDNRPVFNPASYRQSVDEGLPAGQSITTVSATDIDQQGTPNSNIVFSITDVLGFDTTRDLTSHFVIDRVSGEISTNVILDYESVRSYRLTVEASDTGEPQRSSNAFVSVTVLDVNDHIPVLSLDLYEFVIPEDTSVNSRFPQIVATDNDATINARITYSIDITRPFRIDPTNGELILMESLDYETVTEYNFTVTATDGGGLTDSSFVVVTIVDANDNRPRFEQDLYAIAVDEGEYSQSSINLLSVVATDEDSGLLGTVSYAIVPPSSQFSINTINGIGHVLVVAELDREVTEFYRITIVATDGGGPSALSAMVAVEVTVRDVNDVAPALARSEYSVAILENSIPGDVIVDVDATDEDAGTNGQVLFSFVKPSPHFAIDELTGEITTLSSFDYEQRQSYTLTILARDNSTTSSLASTARFVANITDVNDNAPVYTLFPESRTFLESTSPGTEIARVSANDRDSGDNGDIFYQLSNDEGKFAISSAGVITLVNPLDREVTDQYNLTVTVLDRGQPQMSAINYIVISVSDENDVVPSFLSDTYNFLVSEDVFPQSTVGTVFADDTDLGDNGNVLFQLLEGDSTVFQLTTIRVPSPSGVQRFAGVLVNRRFLDYETETSYSLVIQAINTAFPRHESAVNVTVTVRDTNDNTPRFSMPDGYILSVSEAAPVGTPVGTVVATDNDGGLNGTITYMIGGGTPAEDRAIFSINNETGVLTVASALNFETRAQYNLDVVATDSAPPTNRRSASVSVRVDILDFNELGPVFSQNIYTGSIDENLSAGANVVVVNATEGDGGGVIYSLVAGDLSKFAIDSVTGLITTLESLDREDQNRYVLTVQARDTPGSNALSSFAQVEVTVSDVNDNNPEFSQDQYEFSLREHSPVGEALPIVTATDRDIGPNARLTYSLSTGAGQFVVDSETGEITVASPSALDRETTPRVSILLTATDNGVTRRASTVPITVVLTNINDFSPVFDSPTYSQSVPENSQAGVSILMVHATDGDGDTVTYTIASGDDPAPNNKFTINSGTGLLETTGNVLDRESLVARDFSYTLFIDGTDNGGSMGGTNRSTIVPVTITVTDVNDISPECPAVPSTFTIAEANSLEVRIGQITATDGDLGTNALVNYRIAGGDISGQFRIATTTGDLFARPGLDYETTPEYNLRIAAYDLAPNPTDRRTSTCMVTVTLTDENDNRPVFDLPLYQASVVENATIGHTVTVVRATDDDDSGSNSDITYAFQSSVRAFAIDRVTGVITVSGNLDSETLDRYQLDVEAADGGLPRRIGVTQVVIQVVNINDNSPRFDRSFYAEEVREDANVDTSITTIAATDSDSPSLTYAIAGGNDEGYFKINTMTGLIRTARNLDREQVAVFNLLVEARDEDFNRGTTRLQVTIMDVNDEAPRFLQPSYSARVTENSPRGTQVIPELNMTTIRIEALDADEPNTQNSRVLYRLAGENSDLFAINFDTGIITVARGALLDFETLPEIVISIVASDSVPVPDTQSSSVELTIQILDENDNPPGFTQPFGYVIVVEENLEVGTIISNQIQATDPDTGLGGEVRYSISNANPLEALQWFGINRTSGELLLTASLDRESYGLINLMVIGSDRGVPPLSSVVSVQVSVADVNDNAPRFSQNVYTASVPEFLATGTSATRVFASDPDVGSNGEVEFSLLTTNEPFTINPVTGEVTTTSTLDHETQNSHMLTVQACDDGDIQLCNTASVVINVLDFNDEAPRFDVAEYAVDVCETAVAGQPLVQPVATDLDSGVNAVLTYTLQNEVWGLTDVNRTSGLISLSRDVDDLEVSVARYEFMITATDGGDTPLSGSARVVVRVLNCTEREFFYSRPYFYFEMRENGNQFTDGRTGQVIGASFSPDVAEFYPVDFPQNPFSINLNLLSLKSVSELQAIGLSTGLDRERRDLYTVIVRASRQSQTAFTSVTVRVLDVNDNSPVFQSALYVFNIPENVTQTSVVGTVLAEDQDEGSYAVVKYTILGVSPLGPKHPFIVNSSTGVIRKEFDLDREVVEEYQISVQASDSLTTNETTVVVNVLDINDCVPTFTVPSYNEEVLENLPAGVVVTTVTANDCDAGDNAVVRYEIVGGDLSVFAVDPVSGEITTSVVLDYETVSSYYLRIRAMDMGRPTRLFSEADVNIQVLDFNDCPPEFVDPPPSRNIPEDSVAGSVVFTFAVDDCDGGLNGVNGSRFSIIAGNEEQRFDIIEETGLLFTTATLDRELRGSYLLSIQARDSATANRLSSVVQLNIIVGDVNDNDPIFIESEIFITVGEGEEIGEVLVQGQLANDDDAGINGQISYSLLSDEGVFSIDTNTGAVTLSSSLDRETRDSYELTIIARDRADEPRSSNATIFVTVRDANDNAPVILNITTGVTTTQVEEDADFGTLVFNVRATDEDDGSNAEITFSLNDPNQPFDISPSGGAITVAGPLDYETRTEYSLVVIATDRGSPQQLSTLARLTVRITDKNDNPPTFEQSVYARNQDENTAVGTSILSVLARDRDQTGSPNALVEYSLIYGDVAYFSVDPSSGVISNQVVLDRERQSFFSLVVLANNSLSSTPLMSIATVRINVSDVNDEYPQFEELVSEVVLSESALPNTRVVDVNAYDNDQDGPNSDLIYSISIVTNVGNLFHIDPDTGLITLQNSLDYETRPFFALEVVAEDKGSQPLRNTTTVYVNVTDANDILPEFTEPGYTTTVSEGLPVRQPLEIANLRYADGDSAEDFRRSRFDVVSVEGPNGERVDSNLFSVSTSPDDNTGVVSLTRAVDYEAYTSYRVILSVTNDESLSCPPDSRSCQQSNTATLDVLVVDYNDNEPQFSPEEYRGEVSTSAPPDTSILSVSAIDNDRSRKFSTVKYRLDEKSLREGKFRIDENTGTLFTRTGFEEDGGFSYPLTVTAYDNDGDDPSLTDDAQVTLVVLDNFQRVAIVFKTSLTTIINKQDFIVQLLENITNYDVVVEQYASYSNETHTLFIFHAMDSQKNIIDFNEFLQAVGDDYNIIFNRLKDCNITTIMSFAAMLTVYRIPPLLDQQTVVILVFCLLLVLGAIVLLAMGLRQRYVAWTQERIKQGALATNHLFGPGSLEEQGHYHTDGGGIEEQYELMQKGNFLNPMYVVPVSDAMADLETSAAASTTALSSMHRNNPLYESQEISMDMFKEPDYDDDDDDLDDDGTDALAAALADDDDEMGAGQAISGVAVAGDHDSEDDEIERTMI